MFLSHNAIEDIKQMSCVFQSTSIVELSLDGNPVTIIPSYRALMINSLPSLQHLDLKRITEDEKAKIRRKERSKLKVIEHNGLPEDPIKLQENRRTTINDDQPSQSFHDRIENDWIRDKPRTPSEEKTNAFEYMLQKVEKQWINSILAPESASHKESKNEELWFAEIRSIESLHPINRENIDPLDSTSERQNLTQTMYLHLGGSFPTSVLHSSAVSRQFDAIRISFCDLLNVSIVALLIKFI